MKGILVGLICLIVCTSLQGQTFQDTIPVKDTLHSPTKAAKYSLIFPGAGQVYNHMAMPRGKKKAWWKLPLIYAGLGFTGYLLVENHILQRDLKNEYIYRSENKTPNINFPQFFPYDDAAVLQLYQQHKTSRDLMIFAVIGVYGFNVLDALVEGHFVDFDVSDNLSLSIQPNIYNRQTAGISFSFKFR